MNKAVGAIGTVAVGALVVGAAVLVLHSAPVTPPTLTATATGSASSIPGVQTTASLDLATYPDSAAITWRTHDPHPDWVSYGPTTVLQVPAHALITVTIKQYDTAETIPNPFLAQVHGTVGGTATIDGKVVTGIPADQVGHTFTIHNFPQSGQDPLFVSVALPGLPETAAIDDATGYARHPHVVTFQFVTGRPGTYAWNCEFPCGEYYASFGGPMSAYGYMAGTLNVV